MGILGFEWLLDPVSGRHYVTVEPPEAFFGDLVEADKRESGMVRVFDKRLPSFREKESGGSEYIGARYAHPTKLAQDLANAYPMGATFEAIHVYVRDSGQILTTITKLSGCRARFPFVFWVGLTPEKA